MSIRIYNDGLAGAAASETSRAAELSRGTATGNSTGGTGALGEDQVQISSLSEAISAAQSERASRVQDLAAVYQSGGFQVNSLELSSALVDHSLQAGRAGGSQ